jgi:ABC-type bacteriocin/lantibiotic exporter with double-glycine peptidase domain
MPDHIYKVRKTAQAGSAHRRVHYGGQSKMMNCWWACSKMVLDYHYGETRRREIMSASRTAKVVYDRNKGVNWGHAEGRQILTDFKFESVRCPNQTHASFGPMDVKVALNKHGPLLFSGQFVRAFGIRSYSHLHAIVVYGVTADSVYYHDPAIGFKFCTASQNLKWETFKNGWKDKKGWGEDILNVHGLSTAAILELYGSTQRFIPD